MKAFSTLRSDVRMFLDEASPADWTEAQVNSALNYAYHELVTSIVDVFEDYYTTTATFDTIEDQQEYDSDDGLPTDIFKIRRVEINQDPSNSNASPTRALPINLEDVYRDLGNTSTSLKSNHPCYYVLGLGSGNEKMGFLPVPDEDGTNAVKIWYVQTQDDLSASSDTPNIPYCDRYAHLIVWGAVADLLSKGQQEEQASAKYRSMFEVGVQKMKTELEDRKADDAKGVTDTVGLNVEFGYGSTI
jgi:hypothetical protein